MSSAVLSAGQILQRSTMCESDCKSKFNPTLYSLRHWLIERIVSVTAKCVAMGLPIETGRGSGLNLLQYFTSAEGVTSTMFTGSCGGLALLDNFRIVVLPDFVIGVGTCHVHGAC